MNRPITRKGRIIRIGIGLLIFLANGISLGSWLDPLLGWTISSAVWMTTGMAVSLYVFYHTVQLIRQSKDSD
jgi:hypothetical protein